MRVDCLTQESSVLAAQCRHLGPARGNGWLTIGRQTVTYPEFLTYLFDREQTKELAVELAFVIDEHLLSSSSARCSPPSRAAPTGRGSRCDDLSRESDLTATTVRRRRVWYRRSRGARRRGDGGTAVELDAYTDQCVHQPRARDGRRTDAAAACRRDRDARLPRRPRRLDRHRGGAAPGGIRDDDPALLARLDARALVRPRRLVRRRGPGQGLGLAARPRARAGRGGSTRRSASALRSPASSRCRCRGACCRPSTRTCCPAGAPTSPTRSITAARSASSSIYLIAVVGAPFFEELYFRGLVQGTLTARWGIGVGIVVQAVLFALVHLTRRTAGATSGRSSIIAIVGLGLGMIRQLSGRLPPGMFTHAGYNAIIVTITVLTG